MKVRKSNKKFSEKYETKTPLMGQDQLVQSLEALRLLRSEDQFIRSNYYHCCRKCR